MGRLENNEGDIFRFVQGYISHLTSADSGDFTSFTAPGDDDVNAAIDVAEAEIVSWLAEAGYASDVDSYPSLAKRMLSWYVAVGAAYRLEMYHPGLQYGNTGNTRFTRWFDILSRLRDQILDEGISGLGIDVVAGAKLAAKFTARLETEKSVQEDNTDAVLPFFRRRSFRHPSLSDSGKITKDPAIR